MMKIKMSGKSLSEIQWLDNEIQLLLEYTKKLKAEEDYKSLTVKPHMHEIFLQRYCMKWVLGDPLKEMIN